MFNENDKTTAAQTIPSYLVTPNYGSPSIELLPPISPNPILSCLFQKAFIHFYHVKSHIPSSNHPIPQKMYTRGKILL